MKQNLNPTLNLENSETKTQNLNFNLSETQSLLSEYSMRNTVKVGDTQIILSVEPNLVIGDVKKGIDNDYSGKKIALFAEQATLSKDLKAEDAVISLNSINIPSGIKFDFSGNKGLDSDQASDDTTKTNGSNAGNLSLFLESPGVINTNNYIDIKANGGEGGIGKVDVKEGFGNGGKGGDGGSINLYLINSYQKAVGGIDINNITSLATIPDMVKKIQEIINNTTKDVKPYLNNITNFINNIDLKITKDEFINNLTSKVHDAQAVIKYQLSDFIENQKAFIEVGKGMGGVCTSGNTGGKEGIAGKDGDAKLIVKSNENDLLASIEGNNIPVHPSQCSMLLKQIKTKYTLLNSNNQEQFKLDVSDLVTMLNRLIERTKPFVDLKPEDPLHQLYDTNEQKFGASNSVSELKSTYQKASAYMDHLKQGLDVLGYQTNYVPIASINTLQNAMKRLIDNFGIIEGYYVEYLQSLKDQHASGKNMQSLKHSINNDQETIKKNIEHLWNQLHSTENDIANYDPRLAHKKEIAQNILKQYEDAVKGYFDFDIGKLLDAASTIAFVPESAAMWGIEGAKIINDGATEIIDSQGRPVKKDYIVHQIDNIGDKLKDISEGFNVGEDGSIVLEDPGANKLMADKDTIMSLLDEFYGKLKQESDKLKSAIEDYINLVIERNNTVMKYNACISLITQKNALYESNKKTLSDINEAALEANPDLPYVTAFASEAYTQAQDNIIHIMNLASRAYKLWTLDTENTCVVGDTSPVNIDYLTLSSIYNNFYTSTVLKAIEQEPNMVSNFSSKGSGTGVYTFGSNDYFGDFKYGVTFSFKPQFQHQKGSFNGMSQVRVGEVRVYLEGAKMKKGHEKEEIFIDITHGNSDNFVTSDNRKVTFSYDKTFNQSFHYRVIDNEITRHTSYKIKSSIDGHAENSVIGPFADWKITVYEDYNQNLDYASITTGNIRFEFDGTSSSFDT